MSEVLRCLVALGQTDLVREIENDPNPPEKPFRWDGASFCPDRIGGMDFDPAAFVHDVKYHRGRKGDRPGRFKADAQFAIHLVDWCDATPEIAQAMFNAVRTGGSEHLPTPWRWGYGRTK